MSLQCFSLNQLKTAIQRENPNLVLFPFSGCLSVPLYTHLPPSSSGPLPHLTPSPHCLAYLPNLSQPSVVMLYKAPAQQEYSPGGQRSARLASEEEAKRKREESEWEEEAMVLKKRKSGAEESEKVNLRFVECSAFCQLLNLKKTSEFWAKNPGFCSRSRLELSLKEKQQTLLHHYATLSSRGP